MRDRAGEHSVVSKVIECSGCRSRRVVDLETLGAIASDLALPASRCL